MRQDASVRTILQKYGLRKVKTIRIPDNGAVRSYVIRTQRGQQEYILKLFSSPDSEARERFITEIRTIRYLRRTLSSRYHTRIPVIRWFSQIGSTPYYIYSYTDGVPLGTFVSDFGIRWGLFTEKTFDSFIAFFMQVQSLNPSEVPYQLHYDTWGVRTAKKELQHYFDHIQKDIPYELYDQVLSFFEERHKVAFSKKVFSHRDLYPENIVIERPKSDRFVFLDWEYFSLVPIGFDCAFLYLLFWREEFWRARVYSLFRNWHAKRLSRADLYSFDVSFRFSVVILAIRFLYQLESFGDTSEPEYFHARSTFLYLLQSALSSEIVRPANIKFYVQKRELQIIAEAYGIGEVRDYEIFYASKGNTVACVSVLGSKNKYIIRFYAQSRPSTRIRRELSIFEKLSDSGVKTYKVLSTKDGSKIYRPRLYGHTRRVAVLTFLPGKKITKQWANERSAQNAGQMLRKIHNLHIVHGDYSKENVLFVKTKISGVIDFEWGRNTKSREAKVSDLAKAVALWLIDVRNKGIRDELFVEQFLYGYYNKTPERHIRETVYHRIIDKIVEEREIFNTTIDTLHPHNRHAGKRFEHAIGVIEKLIRSPKIT